MNEVFQNVKRSWDRFTNHQFSSSEDEKNQFLDKFLNELCCHEISNDLRLWCNSSNVGNILSHHFLSEIHHIFSSKPDVPEDLSLEESYDVKVLENYLFEVRGWKILHVINIIGVQKLSSCRELSNLLISLLIVCLKIENNKSDQNEFKPYSSEEFPNIDACFVSPSNNLVKRKIKSHMKIAKRSAHRLHARSRLTSNSSESDYDSRSSMSSNNYWNRLESMIESEISSKTDRNDCPEIFSAQNISSVNFSFLILILLQKICYKDMLKQNLTTSPPSFTILPFALETLCSLYLSSESFYAAGWQPETIFETNCQILKLVFISAGAVVVQPGGLDVLEQQHNTIGVLLRLCQQIFNSRFNNKDISKKDLKMEVIKDKNLIRNLKFIFDTLYGCTKLVCHIVDWLSNRKYCGQVIRLLTSLTNLPEGVWTLLTKFPIEECDSIISLLDLSNFIQNIESIISTIHQLKIIHIHNSRCLKRRHRKCHLESVNCHHHNILGFPCNQSNESNGSLCCISYLSDVLVSMFKSSEDFKIQRIILSSLNTCGMCCCLNLDSTLNKLLSKFMICSPPIRANIMLVVEKVMVSDDRKMPSNYVCTLCLKQLNSQMFSPSLYNKAQDTIDSAIGSECSNNESMSVVDDSLRSFELYRELLLLDDPNLQSTVCQHLIRLTMNGNENIKRKIFVHIMLPIYLVADSSSIKSSCQEVLRCCLSIMPTLLLLFRNKIMFLNHGGIKHLNALISSSFHRPLALKILEILVKSDVEENFDVDDPKTQSEIVLSHKNMLVDKTSSFITEIDRQDIFKKKDELRTRKSSLHGPVLCVFDECGELIEASGEELKSFTKPEIEYTFNLFHPRSSPIEFNETSMISILEELKDLWGSPKELLRNCKQYKNFLSDASNLNIFTTALDLIKIIGQEFHKESITSKIPSKKEYKSCLLVKLELFESLLLVILEMASTECVKQVTQTYDVMKTLNTQLYEFHPKNAADFKHLLDVLLHCSVNQSYFGKKHSKLESLSNITTYASDDVEESMYFFPNGEEGFSYDADAEFSTDHDYSSQNIKTKFSENYRMIYPEACRLMLDLMIHKLTIIVSVPASKNKLKSYLAIYVQTFQRLNCYCSQSLYNSRVMHKQNILKKLLDGFHNILTNSNPNYKEFQLTILTTFSLVAKTNLSAKELQRYINLFKVKTAPTEILLHTLLTLVNGMRWQPTCLLSFPSILVKNLKSVPEYQPAFSTDSDIGISPIIDVNGNIPQNLHAEHRENTLPSAWAACSLALPLPGDAIWHPKSKNFAYSLWMRMDKKVDIMKMRKDDKMCSSFSECDDLTDIESLAEQDNYVSNVYHTWGENLHVMSIGSSHLLFELWINPIASNLIFRISHSTNDTYTISSEEKTLPILINSLWHYLTVNVSEKHNRKQVTVTVDVIIDGLYDQSLNLQYNLSSFKLDMSSYLLLGQSCSFNELQSFTGTWHLANVMLFKDKVFTKESSLQMYALGPDVNNLTSCSLGNEQIFIPPHISSSILKSGVDLKILIGDEKIMPKIDALQENLVLIYTPKKKSYYSLFPPTSNLAADVVGSLAQILPVINSFRSMTTTTKSSQQLPLTSAVILLSSQNFNYYIGMDAAIMNIGGISVFLFLFARVVECCDNEVCQSESLQLVLHLLEKNPLYAKEFYKLDGYALILKVLSSSKCKPSVLLLKVLLDSCLSIPVFDHEPVSGRVTIFEENEAIIKNVDLLSHLIGCWRIWDHNSSKLLKILFSCFITLLRENHPFQKFNFLQMHSTHILDKVILFCKERFYYEEKTKMSKEMSNLILKFISSLIFIESIDMNYIMTISDLLLLMHKDTSTYVSTTNPGMYYIMSTYKNAQTPPPMESDIVDNIPVSHLLGRGKLNKAIINNEIKCRSGSITSVIYDEVDIGSATNFSLPIVTAFSAKDDSNNTSLHIVEGEKNQSYIELSDYYADGYDEVDKKIIEAEESLSSTVWYASLENDLEGNFSKSHEPMLPRSSKVSVDKSSISPIRSTAIAVPSTSPPHTFNSGDSYVIVDDIDLTFNSDELVGRNNKPSSPDTLPEVILSEGGDWNVTPQQDSKFHTIEDDGQVNVIVGLLDILAEVILLSPSEIINRLLNHVVTIDLLVILSHHDHYSVRESILNVLNSYISRASNDLIDNIIQMKIFHLFSNQFHKYQITSKMIDMCFSMIFNRTFSMMKPCFIDDITSLSPIQMQPFIPILSLLPKAFSNIKLCHNIICMIKRICMNIPTLTWQLSEMGIFESLMQTLLRVLHNKPESSVENDQLNLDIIFDDVSGLLVVITSNIMSFSGPGKFQMLPDLLHLLSHCEKQEVIHCGIDSKSVSILRSLQMLCIQRGFGQIQNKIDTVGNTTSSFFENVGNKLLQRKSSFEKSVKEMFTSVSSPSSTLIHRLSKSDLMSSNSTNDLNSTSKSVGKSKNSNVNVSDLAERFDILVQKSCEFVIHRDSEYKSTCNEEEQYFIRGLLHLLIQGMASVMEGTRGKKRNTWSSMMWINRNTLRVRLSHFFCFLISPLHNMDQRCFSCHIMAEENKCKEILKTILSSNYNTERRCAIFLHDLLHGQDKSSLTNEHAANIRYLIRIMGECKFTVLAPPPNSMDEWARISEDKKNYMKHLQKEKAVITQQKQVPEYRLRHKYDILLHHVVENADKITQSVALKKNLERKVFIDHVRKIYMERLEVRKAWRNLRDQLSHERGVWYFKESYPTSWQLDPTEGPHRIRKRLERCHLNLKPKFFRVESKNNFDLSTISPPLEYLLDDEDQIYDVSSLLYRLNTSEVISFNCPCKIVNINLETPGEILIAKSALHFVSDVQPSDMEAYVLWKDSSNFSLIFLFEEFKEVLKRRFQLQDNAIEIFLTDGRTYLIAFETTELRDVLHDKLLSCSLPNLVSEIGNGNIQYVTQLWRDGFMTNFEYLTQLNKLAGRSANDLMQYPVFPFVLSDYTSSVLDLTNTASFRILGRPMPVQDKTKEAYYIKTYEYLKREMEVGYMDGPFVSSSGAYHYSSLYSNSGNILHYMVRLPPYTSMLVAYQDNNFDVPDRTFHSMETCWRIASSQAGTDVKELIPELFYLPEFLLNSEGFNLGVRQSGECVDDVILPNWCRNNARLFIMIHRQALESDQVTEHINDWIDLTFGYKQSGRAALDAVNVYHPITHFGLDVKAIDDPIKRVAMFTMIKTYGQMPKKLFQSRHPMVSLNVSKGELMKNPQVIPEVLGLKWGSYVGSPAEPEPIIVWRKNHRSNIGSFVPLSTNDVFGLMPKSCLIVSYCKEKGATLINTTYVTAAALVTWGHFDDVLRIKFRKDHQLLPVLKSCPLDTISVCASVPDSKLLFVGHSSGLVDVYTTSFDPSKPQIDLKKKDISLIGHKSEITVICICRSFSITVTASKDGTIIIWDLNKLSYVRFIDQHDGKSIKLISVSDTSGDIASVSDNDSGSTLKLHTINGSFVGTVVTNKKIHSVCFSNAPEGVSVNAIACGMDNGVIKLWSSWDLALITEIRAEKFLRPVLCLVFSSDSQHLYAANDHGTVIIWEKPSKGFHKTPKFLPML